MVNLVCRGCMSSNVKLFNLKDDGIGKVFEDCTRLVLNQHNSLPPYICQSCLTKCNDWKQFQKQCEKNEEVLISLDNMNNSKETTEPIIQFEQANLPVEVILSDSSDSDYETPLNKIKVVIPAPFKIFVQPIVTKLANNGKLNIVPKSATKSLATIFKCKICKQTFKTITAYESHYKSAHSDRELPCLICDNKFKGDANLLIHQRQFHTVTILRSVHFCGACKTNFSAQLEFTEHQNLKCDRCIKSFCQPDNLKDHLVRIHGDSNQKFKCPKCDKTVGSKSSLKYHLEGHSRAKTFCCYKCGKMFARNGGLERHLVEFHSTDDHIYHCHLCPKTFKHVSTLRSHVSVQHISNAMFSCEICLKTFKHKATYHRHKMIHDDNRPFECSICGQRFIQKSALKPHLKRHEEVNK